MEGSECGDESNEVRYILDRDARQLQLLHVSTVGLVAQKRGAVERKLGFHI